MLVRGDSPQSITLSMVIHRMTGFKQMTNLLSRADFGSSYTNVSQETKQMHARNESSLAQATFLKRRPTHAPLITPTVACKLLKVLATTHHTNLTIYVPKSVNNSSYQLDNIRAKISYSSCRVRECRIFY